MHTYPNVFQKSFLQIVSDVCSVANKWQHGNKVQGAVEGEKVWRSWNETFDIINANSQVGNV